MTVIINVHNVVVIVKSQSQTGIKYKKNTAIKLEL